MRLGYYDRACPEKVYVMPKLGHDRKDLFAKESTTEYALRFFKEIKGLGNVRIVKDLKTIAKRGM